MTNLTCEMLGHISNPDLMQLYADSQVDLFLNSSSKEGVPVSIMEAMVRGVPTVAPDVGAIREVVLPELLLPADLTPQDLATGCWPTTSAPRTPPSGSRSGSTR